MAATTRKTRFVCVSDTHNATANGSFKLPKGDVLIHAGDLTNQGSFSELQKTVTWIEEADFEAKIVIGGKLNPVIDKKIFLLKQETMMLPSTQPSIINMVYISTIRTPKIPQSAKSSLPGRRQ
jgi:predicted phosphodiesterase